MKKRILIIPTALAAIVLCGCWLKSVYPFYLQENLTFDVAMVGTWIEKDKDMDDTDEAWVFTRAGDQRYRLEIRDLDDGPAHFDARLFKLGDHLFLDLLSTQREISTLPGHHLLLVQQIEPNLILRIMDPEWMMEWLKAHPDSLRHAKLHDPDNPDDPDKYEVVLTAETATLQKFVLQHFNDEGFWGEDPLELKKVALAGANKN